MHKKPIISPLWLLPAAAFAGCVPATKPAVLSGGDFYPDGCTVSGRSAYDPDHTSRRFPVPVYVLPAETLDALLSE